MALVNQARAVKVFNVGIADKVDIVRRIAGTATIVASQATTKEIVQSPEAKEEKGKLAGRGLSQSRAKEKVKVEKVKEKASKAEKERKEPKAGVRKGVCKAQKGLAPDFPTRAPGKGKARGIGTLLEKEREQGRGG